MNSVICYKDKNRRFSQINQNSKNQKIVSLNCRKARPRSNTIYNQKAYKKLYLDNIEKKSTENKELIKILNNTSKAYNYIGQQLDVKIVKNLNEFEARRFNEVNRGINDVGKLIEDFDREFINYNINYKTRPKSSSISKKNKIKNQDSRTSVDGLIEEQKKFQCIKNNKTIFFKEQKKIENKFRKPKELLILLNTLKYCEQKGLLTEGNTSHENDNKLSFFREKVKNKKNQKKNIQKIYRNIDKEIFPTNKRKKSISKYNTSFFIINSPVYPEKSLNLALSTTDRTKNLKKNRPKSSDCRYFCTNAQKEDDYRLFNTETKNYYSTQAPENYNNASKNLSNNNKSKRPASSYDRAVAISKIYNCNNKMNDLLNNILEDSQKIDKKLRKGFPYMQKENEKINKNKNKKLHVNINQLRTEMDLQESTKYKIDVQVLLLNNAKKLKKYLQKEDLKMAEQLSRTVINEDRLNNKPLEFDETFNNKLFRRKVKQEINEACYKTRVIKETLNRLSNKSIIDPKQQLDKLIGKNNVCLFNDFESLKKLVKKYRIIKKQIFFPK